MRWFKRNSDFFKTIRTKTLAKERMLAHQEEEIQQHFDDFYGALARYGILYEDIYNMDETGFRIGVLADGQIVITHLSTRYVFKADPDNREYITAVECICADGSSIPPMLILQGEVLLEKYFDNSLDDDTLIAANATAYMNQGLGLKWITHFHNMTFKKTKGKWRMLDGHGSHTSEELTLYYWEHKIIPFQLPSHSSHILQPLDVGIFQTLKH
jgi:hypothetical protein